MLYNLPIGLIIVDDKKKIIKLMNKEMKGYTPVETESLTTTMQFNTTGLEELTLPSSIVPGSLLDLSSIKDRDDTTLTLSDLIMKNSSTMQNDCIYNMSCEKRQKVFEVQAKCLTQQWPEGYKIILVKDQTVYEQLLKEKMLDKCQRMLLSSISHVIRNPLNVIEGCSTMLTEGYENSRELCQKIKNSVAHIDYIISGACYLSAKESCSSTRVAESFAVSSTVNQIIDMIKESVNKDVILSADIDSSVPASIYSDCKKYKIILFNLLENASKYTYRGKIKVNILYCPESLSLITKVEDTGIGIKEESMPKLFKLYSNIDHVNSYNPQGMNLGLALCKKLSIMLGGDISATSILGCGSAFTFFIKDDVILHDMDDSMQIPSERLRRGKTKEAKIVVPSTFSLIKHADTESFNRPCRCPDVLVVDDDPTNRLILKTYLKDLGFSAEEALNGAIAVKKVEARMKSSTTGCCCLCKRYKLILMDVNMPEMDGTTAAQILESLFKEYDVMPSPIIAVTAATIEVNPGLLSSGFKDISIFLSFY